MTDAHNAMKSSSRRDAVLEALLADMATVHRHRRQRRRIASVTALLALLCSVSAVVMHRSSAPTHPSAGAGAITVASDQTPSIPARARFVLVETDSRIISRYTAPDPPRIVQILNDDQLLSTLTAINRPAGLVHSNGRTWLTAAVTDELHERPWQRELPAKQRRPPL